MIKIHNGSNLQTAERHNWVYIHVNYSRQPRNYKCINLNMLNVLKVHSNGHDESVITPEHSYPLEIDSSMSLTHHIVIN